MLVGRVMLRDGLLLLLLRVARVTVVRLRLCTTASALVTIAAAALSFTAMSWKRAARKDWTRARVLLMHAVLLLLLLRLLLLLCL